MESYDFFVVYKLCTTRHFLCSFYKRAIYKYSAAMYNKFQDGSIWTRTRWQGFWRMNAGTAPIISQGTNIW